MDTEISENWLAVMEFSNNHLTRIKADPQQASLLIVAAYEDGLQGLDLAQLVRDLGIYLIHDAVGMCLSYQKKRGFSMDNLTKQAIEILNGYRS